MTGLWAPFLTLLTVAALADLTSPNPAKALAMFALLYVWGVGLWLASSSPFRAKVALWSAVAGSIAISGMALLQVGEMARPRSVFASPNYLGAFCALSVFVCVYAYSKAGTVFLRKFTLTAIAGNLTALWLSQSRSALYALIFGGFIAAPRRWKLAVAAAAGPLVWIVYGLHGDMTSLLARQGLWINALRFFNSRPLLGWGQGVAHLYGLTFFYNVVADWLVTAGICGVAAFLWCVVSTGTAIWNTRDTVARRALGGLLAAYLVNGMMLSDTLGVSIILIVGFACLASEHRNVADRAVSANHQQPVLHGGMRTHGAD